MQYYFEYETEIGKICLVEDKQAITGLYLLSSPLNEGGHGKDSPGIMTAKNGENRETELIKRAHGQLADYFLGKRREFDLPLSPGGTEFQKKVWEELRKIPYGETRGYGEIATAIGNPKACRAVGGANHRNPIMILIPCHRVIGADGSMTGYGGGIRVKEYLLALEQKNTNISEKSDKNFEN